jgi:predicted Zn-dependent protease
MLDRNRARAITRKILSRALAPDVTVVVHESREANLRFANGGATTNGDVERLAVSVTATIEGRSATARALGDDDDTLARVLTEAEEMAALSPVDPEHMPPLPRQTYEKVRARDAATATLTAAGRASVVERVLEVARARGTSAAGLFEHREDVVAHANSAGLFAMHASTHASLSATHRTADGTGSGRAAIEGHAVSAFDEVALSTRAAQKAELSRNPKRVKPGEWTVLLEPQAVADLLGFLVFGMSRRSADEGRSAFSAPGGGTKLGEQLFAPSITLTSDPTHPQHPADPIGGEGLPQRRVTWIEGGVLRELTCSRHWAAKTGATPIPTPSSLHLHGTEATLDDLVAGIDRGIVVTRFWYNRMVEPRTLLATGLTRDGTFLVDKGKIVRAVKNFRYNESPIGMLSRAAALGRPERVEGSRGRVVVVPPIVVDGFRFSSTSDAV